MRADRVKAEVERLDPESRALLDLSLVRGLSDSELATMLGTDPERLRARREAVMSRLGADSDDERAALGASLRESESESEATHAAGEPGRRQRTAVLAAVGGIAVALVVALGLALGRDDAPTPSGPAAGGSGSPSDGSAPSGGAPSGGAALPDGAQPPGGAPPDASAARLTALGGGEAIGSARITGPAEAKLLRLSVRGLPRPEGGGYVVWLYDSVSRARPLTGSRAGVFSVREPLPEGYRRFDSLDVSREPADGNPNHSGQSVLRVPIEAIPGA